MTDYSSVIAARLSSLTRSTSSLGIDARLPGLAVNHHRNRAFAIAYRDLLQVQRLLILLLAVGGLREYAELDGDVEFGPGLVALASGVVPGMTAKRECAKLGVCARDKTEGRA